MRGSWFKYIIIKNNLVNTELLSRHYISYYLVLKAQSQLKNLWKLNL